MSKPDIGVVIPHLSDGGAEKVLSVLSTEMEDFDWSFYLFEDRVGYPIRGDVHTLELTTAGDKGVAGKLAKLGKGVVNLERLKQSERPDIALSFLTLPNIMNLLTSGGQPTLVSERTNLSTALVGRAGRVYGNLVRRLYPKADGIIVLSHGAANDLTTNFGVPESLMEVIYNPIDAGAIRRRSLESSPGFEGAPLLVHAGRMVREKSQWFLVEVVAELKKRRPGTRLVFLGDGPLKPKLVERAKSHSLRCTHAEDDTPGDIHFIGFQSNPFPFIAAADLFVFTSSCEGLGNILIETLATGTPIVSSDIDSGPREILAPDTPALMRTDKEDPTRCGLLMPAPTEFETDNASSLVRVWADSIEAAIDDQDRLKKWREGAVQRAKDFDVTAIIPQWQSYLENWV